MNQNRQGYEYHITLLSVRMRVKFPCKMKIQHQGNLMTADIPSGNNDNRYIFNQTLIIKTQQRQTECFELLLHLVTDKGAQYIGGVVKLYHSEMIRSQGQKLSLSLSKCVDSEAFCEIRINKVVTLKDSRSVPYHRKSVFEKNVPSYKQKQDLELSPFRNALHVQSQQSKSEFNFPVYQSNVKQDQWDKRTKVRYPPVANYSRVKTPSKLVQESFKFSDQPQIFVNRERKLESEMYKEQYQKLKQKYKKETQIKKHQANKRLALQNNENNLKLEIMRLKLRLDEQDKLLNERSSKLKDFQNSYSAIKQKQAQNNYLIEELKQRDATIDAQASSISALDADLTQLKEMTRNRGTEENQKVRQLRSEVQNLRVKLENKEKQLEHQNKVRKQLVAEKQHEILIKQQQLQRNKKVINDLQKAIQNKNYDLQKTLHNDRSNNKNKVEELKLKIDKMQKEASQFGQQKKQLNKKIEQLKSINIKMQYQKKLLSQQYDSLQEQSKDYRNIKEKYNQIMRQNKNLAQQKIDIQRQLQRISQNKDQNVNSLTQQLRQQSQHFREVIKEFQDKDRRRVSEYNQIDSQLQQTKNQVDKQRKNIQGLSRQLQQCKQRQKNAKKAVKSKQHESLGMQTQYATLKQKIKTIDQIYKLQADKITEQADKYRIQLEQTNRKLLEIQNFYNQLGEQHSKLKTKLHYFEQRSDRDAAALKEKQFQYENYIKDTQEQITDLQKTIATLRASQKQLTNKLQRIQVDSMRKDERAQKSKRDIRILEEKCNNYEVTIKTKNSEKQGLISQKEQLQAKLAEKQAELVHLRSDYLIVSTQKSKLTKINELIQQNLQKSKEQALKYLALIEQKEKKQAQLLNTNKSEKQEFVKLQFNHNSLKKQNQRNKETLYQIIQRYIVSLIAGKYEQQQKINQKSSSKIKQMTFTETINLISSNGKQLKQTFTKLIEQNKQILKDKERLQHNSAALTKNLQQKQSNHAYEIKQLQGQLQQIYEVKQTQKNNYTIIINELNQKIKQKEDLFDELNTQIEQLNFTINSVKLDSQALNQQNTKRIASIRKANLEWQEKAQNLLMVVSDLQDKNTQLTEQEESLNLELFNQREQISKRDKIIGDIKVVQLEQQSSIDALKKRNKQLSQSLSDCQLYLSAEKQATQKLKETLESQQRRSANLKNFINQLMKQKQTSIKNELEKNQSITNLEASFLELSKNNQLLQEQNERLSKIVQTQKSEIKRYGTQQKELQNLLKEQRNNHSKFQERLREKQKDLTNKEQLIKKHEQKYQKTWQKLTKQLTELKQQLQQVNYKSSIEAKQQNQTIATLSEQLRIKKIELTNLQQKANQSQESLYTLNQKYLNLQEYSNYLKSQNEEFKSKLGLLDTRLNELADQIKEGEQKLFQYSGKNYTLQLKLQGKQNEFKQRFEALSSNYNNKVDSLCEEYEQRIDIVQKEKDYFKGLCEQRDKQIVKVLNSLRSTQHADNQTRKSFEQKIKKLEEQKLAITLSKNNQIQKYSQQIRILTDQVKIKETELRRTFNQLEISKKTIANLDIKARQSDEKVKSMVKIYQAEIDQLKKKDALIKPFKQNITNHLWNCERETKKSIQNFIRSFLEINQDENSQKVIQLARNLETSILNTVAFNFIQK